MNHIKFIRAVSPSPSEYFFIDNFHAFVCNFFCFSFPRVHWLRRCPNIGIIYWAYFYSNQWIKFKLLLFNLRKQAAYSKNAESFTHTSFMKIVPWSELSHCFYYYVFGNWTKIVWKSYIDFIPSWTLAELDKWKKKKLERVCLYDALIFFSEFVNLIDLNLRLCIILTFQFCIRLNNYNKNDDYNEIQTKNHVPKLFFFSIFVQ